jgi:carbohydrate-binding DOMON domain-containing protein
MSTQYRLVQSGKTASGGCSAGQGSSEPVAPRIYLFILFFMPSLSVNSLNYIFDKSPIHSRAFIYENHPSN